MVEFKGFEKFEVISEEALQVLKGGSVITPVLGNINSLISFAGKFLGRK